MTATDATLLAFLSVELLPMLPSLSGSGVIGSFPPLLDFFPIEIFILGWNGSAC